MINLEEICTGAKVIVHEVVEFIRNQSGKLKLSQIEKKGFNDLVSYVDITAEQMLVDRLQKLIPGSGFITEENTASNNKEEYIWVIDPLDGTTNFVHGVPCYAVSVALMQNSDVVMGIVHEVNLDECFCSWNGAPAFLNNRVIGVSNRKLLSESLIATGFPYTNFDRLKEYMDVFDFFMKNTHGIRRPGSAAVDLAYVAAGRFDAFYEYGLNAWDVAAGAYLVKQAGGRVTDFSGSGNYIFGKEIVAASNHVFDEFFKVVNHKMVS